MQRMFTLILVVAQKIFSEPLHFVSFKCLIKRRPLRAVANSPEALYCFSIWRRFYAREAR